jgi:hypothetical protein
MPSDRELIESQMETAGETYETLVEEHGLIRGTIKYYKIMFGGD